MDDDTQLAVDQARELDTLRQTPEWAWLVAEVAARREGFERAWLRALRRGEVPESLEYERGFLAGADWIVGSPDRHARIARNTVRRVK